LRIFVIAAVGILAAWGPALSATQAAHPSDQLVEHDVNPAETDNTIRHHDAANVAAFMGDSNQYDRLLVFFESASSLRNAPSRPFLMEALAQHYRVLTIDYVYNPAGTVLCNASMDPCFSKYRQAKVFGGSLMKGLEIVPPEALVARTSSMLNYLNRTFPSEHWDSYLDDGAPRWKAFAVSGFSQGSGLAAYLAKHLTMARVILLSSPWDHYDATGSIAAWLSEPSATPADHWWGMYAAREVSAGWMQKTYAALKIPADHIRLVTDAPQCGPTPGIYMPYHWSVTGWRCSPRTPDGRFMEKPLWDAVLGDGSSGTVLKSQ